MQNTAESLVIQLDHVLHALSKACQLLTAVMPSVIAVLVHICKTEPLDKKEDTTLFEMS